MIAANAWSETARMPANVGRSLADRRPLAEGWEHSTEAGVARSLLFSCTLVPTLRALCRPFRVEGAEELRAIHGPLLIVANHTSHLDTPILLAALPSALRRRTAVAAAEDYFYRAPALGLAVSLTVGAFPFPRDRRCTLGLARAAGLLRQGHNVLLFPEGTRSRDGRLAPFRRGVGWLLARSGATVLPAAICGAHTLQPRGARRPRRGPVTVRFGAPWTPATAMNIDHLTDALHARVATLGGAATSDPAPHTGI